LICQTKNIPINNTLLAKISLHRNLGSIEIQDQISATRTLIESYSFLDKNRTAIWGFSHGGFATLMTLAQDVSNPVFSCGIAGTIVDSE
jgi:dipeptidyl-peptidase 4